MSSLVVLQELTRRFGEITAVNALTLEVAQGELFGLVGPDGAGKTTTLRMLAGVLRPTSGDALVDGASVARNPEAVKPALAYMSQRFGLYADLTVEENLDFYADLYRVPQADRRERLERLYRFSSLGPFRKRLAGQLSGGMKQKLGLSCALIHQPRLLLLDEPTFGVDPVSRRDLWLIVHERVAQGVTAVVSTAYMDEAERFDRLAFLEGGRLLALGTPRELQSDLKERVTALYLAEPRRAQRIASATPGVLRAAVFGDRIHVSRREGDEVLGSVVAALETAGCPPTTVAEVAPSLEDVFISLATPPLSHEGGSAERQLDRSTAKTEPAVPAAPAAELAIGRTTKIAVSAHNLSCRFGDFVAVDAVSFEVREREVFGFLGPNGAGKTTTIKMLTGLLAPSSGVATVTGCDLAIQRGELRQKIGYMSQLFSLYPDLTVEENIAFSCGLYAVPRKRRAERRDWVLAMAGLSAQRRRRTGELPLGWKQRLALGCAVLHEPPILFLDEPTSGVDPISRRSFWDLIYSLTEAGTTVFVTTHYMEEAEYCHRLALMNRGRLIALDRPAALKASSHEPLFEVETEHTVRAVEMLQGAAGVVRCGMFGRALHVTTQNAEEGPATIRRALEAEGVAILTLRPIAPSLEDVFIALVAAAGGAVVD